MIPVKQLIDGVKVAGKGALALSEALGVKDLVQLGSYLATKGVDAGVKTIEDRKSLVSISDIHSEDYQLKLDDAKRWLEEDGLRVETVVVHPNPIFKDCSDMEVVGTNYKQKQRLKPGTRVILKCVTDDVIEASKKLFEEAERKKAADEQKKAEKKAEQAQQREEQIIKAKEKFGDAAAAVQKSAETIKSKIVKDKSILDPDLVDSGHKDA